MKKYDIEPRNYKEHVLICHSRNLGEDDDDCRTIENLSYCSFSNWYYRGDFVIRACMFVWLYALSTFVCRLGGGSFWQTITMFARGNAQVLIH